MTLKLRSELIRAGVVALMMAFFLPAVALADVEYTGAALLREVLLRGDPRTLGFAANLVVPYLCFVKPRWPRSEFVLLTVLLAMAAWLTARAALGPLELKVGAWAWWVAMVCLGAVALDARRSFSPDAA